jgi:hypothetical protein
MTPQDMRAGSEHLFRAPPPGGPDLHGSILRARIEDAERSRVIAELRGAEIARLQMLHELLKPVFAELPPDADLFDQGLVPGDRPRLYVDMVSFVEMGHDRKLYRFIQDTRRGRVLIGETEGVNLMALTVTEYLARRLVEREKVMGEEIARVAGPRRAPERRAPPTQEPKDSSTDSSASALRSLGSSPAAADQAIAFLSGIVAGAGSVFVYAWWASGKLGPMLRSFGH